MRPEEFRQMRSKVAPLAALCLALVLPASALGDVGGPPPAARADTAIAYYRDRQSSPTQCVVLSFDVRASGTGLTVQLNGPDCAPSGIQAAAGLTSSQIFGLTAAYVVGSADVGGHTVDVDVAWVATGKPVPHKENNPTWSFVGRDAPAHLTGTVTVDGVPWATDPKSGTLRSGLYRSY
jgi:hypothetical protein